ncbi:MAG: DUF4430 domain-containing protein [Candidatus Doudnabacteria bacterium]
MENIGRKLELFVIVVIIATIGIIYAFKQKPLPAPVADNANVIQNDATSPSGQTSVNPAPLVPSNIIEYPGVDGQNALELLKASHRVEATHYSFGDMVSGIDGVSPDSKHFWAMYVNGQFSQVGASAYVTKSTDMIKWEIDAVDTTK